jgi:hypothetical protein
MTTRKIILAILIIIFSHLSGTAQNLTSTLKGKVIDVASEAPIPFATVTLLNTSPIIGTSTDINGEFTIKNIPVGRYDIKVSSVGYEPTVLSGILLISGKTKAVTAHLQESVISVKEVTVKPKEEKNKAINQMATVSAKQFTVEETNKYAGGVDDPARMVSAFAGVASTISSNGIVIRGNAPKGLLWRMEGVPVPAPNHFGEISGVGAGVITALSSQMMANSDFFTGAFPAEYGNATSGVFDLSMRTGNNLEREHTFQIGSLGIDVSSEGPFKQGGNSSYLFNYRYSTLALVDHVMPQDVGGIRYQDLSFKLHFPTKKAGTFSVWGLGLIDGLDEKGETDSSEWESIYDSYNEESRIYMGIGGVTHKYFFNKNTYVKTILAGTGHGIGYSDNYLDSNLNRVNDDEIWLGNSNITLSSFINHKFNSRHTNRTGIVVQKLFYNYRFISQPEYGEAQQTYVNDKGNSELIQAFSQSSFNITKDLQINPGVHFQMFTLSKRWIIEPRLSAQWNLDNKQSITLGYGLHSSLEKLNYYFTQVQTPNGATRPNTHLDFSKAHHFVLGYNRMVGKNTNLRIEPFFQYLYDIPVIADSSFSFLNLREEWFLEDKFENSGLGRNIGIDITLERFLNNGWYYLTTASIFDSKYKAGDNVWRNTAFNKKFVGNFLIGKEWAVGSTKQNLLNISTRFTYNGGDWFTPANREASLAAQETVRDYGRTFKQQGPGNYFLHFTISYRRNRAKYSSVWSLQVLNVLGSKEYYGEYYDRKTNTIVDAQEAIIFPNLSYKIQF